MDSKKKQEIDRLLRQIKRCEKEFRDAEKEKIVLEERQRQILKEMNETFGVKNIKEAEELLSNLEKDLLKDEEVLNELKEKMDSLMDRIDGGY